MSRILVANDRRTVHVEVTVEPVEGLVTATCEDGRCGWVSEPFCYSLPDALDEAGTHLDQEHQ